MSKIQLHYFLGATHQTYWMNHNGFVHWQEFRFHRGRQNLTLQKQDEERHRYQHHDHSELGQTLYLSLPRCIGHHRQLREHH